ncbi:unnamed protein product [Haemonchus placei]|uniref:Transposase n=1 Tax=Haemonchus placei TaxID=6290 RepID=A0A0N4VUI4_HAEPC|nr:unnamed protein product [Haemonchus placei]
MTKEEFDDWLAGRGFLWKDCPSPNYGNLRKATRQKCLSGKDRRWKLQCPLRSCRQPGVDRKAQKGDGSNARGGRAHRPAVESMVPRCARRALHEQRCTDWRTEYHRAGRRNNIVRCKYNVDRVMRKDWLVGGIQDGTKVVFIEIVDKRDAAAQERIIRQTSLQGEPFGLICGVVTITSPISLTLTRRFTIVSNLWIQRPESTLSGLRGCGLFEGQDPQTTRLQRRFLGCPLLRSFAEVAV